MDEAKTEELEKIMENIFQQMAAGVKRKEDVISKKDALEDRLALARRIGRLYLSFSRVLMDRLGKQEGKNAILEAIRDYSYHCAQARKKGMVDLPSRGIHEKQEIVTMDGKKRLRCYGCGIAKEFADQDDELLGALYCYVDPCSFMLTIPHIKLIHTQMEPLGDPCCEFDLAVASSEEMAIVEEKNKDYRDVDPLIKNKTKNL